MDLLKYITLPHSQAKHWFNKKHRLEKKLRGPIVHPHSLLSGLGLRTQVVKDPHEISLCTSLIGNCFSDGCRLVLMFWAPHSVHCPENLVLNLRNAGPRLQELPKVGSTLVLIHRKSRTSHKHKVYFRTQLTGYRTRDAEVISIGCCTCKSAPLKYFAPMTCLPISEWNSWRIMY